MENYLDIKKTEVILLHDNGGTGNHDSKWNKTDLDILYLSPFYM